MTGRLTVTGPGGRTPPDPGRYVCLLCDFDAPTYGGVERHAKAEHPARATRIEWRQ